MDSHDFNTIIDELRQIHKLHQKYMIQKCREVTPEQGKLLFIIYRCQKMSQKELANMLRITEATLSVRIKRLIEAKWVEKIIDENDKRVSQIVLTSKGLKLMESIKESIPLYQNMMCQGISREEYETVLNVLLKMKMNIEEDMQ